MTSYVAPHLRNNKKNIIKEEFPELTNISKKNNKIQNLKKVLQK